MASALDDMPPPPDALDTFEDLRAYLWKCHGVTVGDDDPILLVFSMLRAATTLQERNQLRLSGDLEKTLKAAVEAFTRDVNVSIATFKNEAIGDVVRERVEAMNESAKQADTAVARFKKCLFAQSIMTAVNILAALFTIGVLFTVTR
mgnify:CR=1 FL=1|tara:strand:- start:4200 stop:4640 length:441 start_codon:yes stop_codon:yes gene_type:complete